MALLVLHNRRCYFKQKATTCSRTRARAVSMAATAPSASSLQAWDGSIEALCSDDPPAGEIDELGAQGQTAVTGRSQ